MSSLLISDGCFKRYLVNVKYSKAPGSIQLKDISKSLQEKIFQKIFGFKSKVWAYENEVRIVTDQTKAQYHDYTAVKGIYFGIRMLPDVQTKIMYALRGRGIKYYKIYYSDGKYQLSTRSVHDEYIDAIPYSERNESNDMRLPRHEIRNHDRGRYPNVGKADVTIFTRLTKLELDELTIQIKHKYHTGVNKLFVSYHLPNMNFDSVVWASSRMDGEGVDTSILGLTKEKFELLSEFTKNDKRKILGSWIGLLWLMTLYEQNGRFYFEIRSSLESEHTVEVIANTVENGICLEDINGNSHGEYKILRTDGTLEYYGKDGLFETHTAMSQE